MKTETENDLRLPWTVVPRRKIPMPHGEASTFMAAIRTPDGIVVKLDFGYGSKNDDATAQYIIEACNSHATLTNQRDALREALKAAENAGTYVVKLIESNDKAGQSCSPTEKADWIGTCAHVYAAMAFLRPARAALALCDNTAAKAKEG